jgi:hypothetical protein
VDGLFVGRSALKPEGFAEIAHTRIDRRDVAEIGRGHGTS